MGAKSGIEWTDSTWNPIRGCSRVSEGCRHCYAEAQAAHPRLGGPGKAYEGLTQVVNGHAQWTGEVRFVEEHLLDPLKWGPAVDYPAACKFGWQPHSKQCGCPTRPRRIFVNSMSDLFHENVTDEMRDRIFAVMALCPQHVFQVLTKRPERMLEYFASFSAASAEARAFNICSWIGSSVPKAPMGFPADMERIPKGLANVWMGVSIENQKAADERIPLLLQTPAAVRFVSAEPLLGPLDFRSWLGSAGKCWQCGGCGLRYSGDVGNCKGYCFDRTGKSCDAKACPRCGKFHYWCGAVPDGIDWVICGGESGPEARPMHPDWARGLRGQCEAAGVPFFFKQWGEHLPSMQEGSKDAPKGQPLNCSDQPIRVGKKNAGALLDGVEWKQFPEVRACL